MNKLERSSRLEVADDKQSDMRTIIVNGCDEFPKNKKNLVRSNTFE